VVGSGFGAFRDVIPSYLPRGESEHWLQLHNDYLEVAAGGGLVAMLLVAWLAVGYAVRLARRVRGGTSADDALSSLGLALGVASLAVHEVVDFNLQIPANALLFVVVAACGVAAPFGDGEAA
jgi:O-antigen ligase